MVEQQQGLQGTITNSEWILEWRTSEMHFHYEPQEAL